jgi:hypothetical protein
MTRTQDATQSDNRILVAQPWRLCDHRPVLTDLAFRLHCFHGAT